MMDSKTARKVLDLIDCSTMDARDPVALPKPETFSLVDAAFTQRLCSACKTRPVSTFSRASAEYATCGDPACQRERNRVYDVKYAARASTGMKKGGARS